MKFVGVLEWEVSNKNGFCFAVDDDAASSLCGCLLLGLKSIFGWWKLLRFNIHFASSIAFERVYRETIKDFQQQQNLTQLVDGLKSDRALSSMRKSLNSTDFKEFRCFPEIRKVCRRCFPALHNSVHFIHVQLTDFTSTKSKQRPFKPITSSIVKTKRSFLCEKSNSQHFPHHMLFYIFLSRSADSIIWWRNNNYTDTHQHTRTSCEVNKVMLQPAKWKICTKMACAVHRTNANAPSSTTQAREQSKKCFANCEIRNFLLSCFALTLSAHLSEPIQSRLSLQRVGQNAFCSIAWRKYLNVLSIKFKLSYLPHTIASEISECAWKWFSAVAKRFHFIFLAFGKARLVTIRTIAWLGFLISWPPVDFCSV